MKKKSITLSDIAKLSGVSKATVSLVINNDSRVADKTRRKVLEIVESVGYIHNRGAASLSTGRTNTVGLGVHDLNNPYFTKVVSECEAVLSRNDRMAFLCNTDESLTHQAKFIHALKGHRADGLILSPVAGTDLASLAPILDGKLPTVLIARYIEGAKLDFVVNDGVPAMKKVTEHLIELGHTRIAMAGGGQKTSVSRNRRNGFLAAMEEHGLDVDDSLWIRCETSPEGGEEALEILLNSKNPPTAVVSFADLIGIGIISSLHRRGLEPGRDLAVVSCDDIEEASRGYVQLTTMETKKSEIGRMSAELLIRRINEPDAPLRHIHLQAELIIRKSCGYHLKHNAEKDKD